LAPGAAIDGDAARTVISAATAAAVFKDTLRKQYIGKLARPDIPTLKLNERSKRFDKKS
jgi:hypothetical protein